MTARRRWSLGTFKRSSMNHDKYPYHHAQKRVTNRPLPGDNRPSA
jgi:hypothetical protein